MHDQIWEDLQDMERTIPLPVEWCYYSIGLSTGTLTPSRATETLHSLNGLGWSSTFCGADRLWLISQSANENDGRLDHLWSDDVVFSVFYSDLYFLFTWKAKIICHIHVTVERKLWGEGQFFPRKV